MTTPSKKKEDDMNITKQISDELNIKSWQTEAVIRLIDEGNTIPFIARYRKEATGALNDEILRSFDERLKYLRSLQDRKETILAIIESQGKLTDELRQKIEDELTSVGLEDLYRPYRPKRRTRAIIAREKGLEPLALWLQTVSGNADPLAEATRYVSAEKEVPDAETAIKMAQDIIAEELSDNADCRAWIRNRTVREGLLSSSAKNPDAESVYEQYYDYSEPLQKIPGHRILAIDRGEKEKILTVHIIAPEEEIISRLHRHLQIDRHPATGKILAEAAQDAYKRLIATSIENDIRHELTEKAQASAIHVFGQNLRQLLLQPPIQGKTVLGWDPAFRTGCKLCVVDPTGKVLDTTVIYPTAPQNKVAEAETVLLNLVRKYHIDLISLGNGTASRESEKIIADFIRKNNLPLQYVIVNEAGASVYSASKTATEEFPNFDVGQRSSASMARRLQDPLAELVKIPPQSIGVGQYQHDMDQNKLAETLSGVVEDCVNSVGVDLNTASAALLSYVSGIGKTIAQNIVAYRETNGAFKSRSQLTKVPRLGSKAYEQCAGFMRIRDGKQVLDMTAVHPENYKAAQAIMKSLHITDDDIRSGTSRKALTSLTAEHRRKLADETGIGEYTLADILAELEKPGRDPRSTVQGPVLRSDVLDFDDLQPGMILKGTVRNVIDFGAFVDIGVHQDGLVHISQLADRYVNHPLDVVSVGDIVDVKILSVDKTKNRISLSMKELQRKA